VYWRNSPATAYLDAEGNYVALRDSDRDIVQVSDDGNPVWKSPYLRGD
jgi:hypothetical protein